MSFKTKLKVAGKEYNVLNVSYGLFKETDATDFFEWMTNSFERKDGSLVFYKRDSEATLKELKFTEAYLVKHKERFDSIGDNPLTESFTISARKIEVGSGEYENEWV
ncbi:MAG TPA: type VI secretion system tube protein TssD [Flavisolibacter sp.]|nr:type VI secretion system tube protein TssD [Flavisolibacter sp.]